MTVKRVAKADMMTRGTVMAMARIGPAQGERTGDETKNETRVHVCACDRRVTASRETGGMQ